MGEIRRRGRLVNETIKPDLVVCLHFNAEEWGNEKRPTLVEENHMHLLVSGNLSADEMTYEDERYDMLRKLLNRSVTEELPVSNALARTLSVTSGLPPYVYRQSNAIHIDDNPYIWARNLLANRLYLCPVVYVEPYVMNSLRWVMPGFRPEITTERKFLAGWRAKAFTGNMRMPL